MDCIFCKIVNGEIPCLKLYEDDLVMALLDINPDSDGHTLIIPKKHYIDLSDIDINTLNHINMVSKKIKRLLEDKLHCEGMSLVQNNGFVQEIKHYHLHLKPYYKAKKNIEMVKYNEYISDPKEVYKKISE